MPVAPFERREPSQLPIRMGAASEGMRLPAEIRAGSPWIRQQGRPRGLRTRGRDRVPALDEYEEIATTKVVPIPGSYRMTPLHQQHAS